MLRPLNILQVVFLLHILAAYVAVFERMKRSEGMIKVTLEKSCIDFFFSFALALASAFSSCSFIYFILTFNSC